MAENKLLDGKIPLYVNGSAIRFNTRLIDSDIFTLLRLPVQGYMLSADMYMLQCDAGLHIHRYGIDLTHYHDIAYLMELLYNDINIPNTYMLSGGSYSEMTVLQPDKDYLIKAMLSARGMGQLVLSGNYITGNLTDDLNTMDVNSFNLAHKVMFGKIWDNEEKSKLYDQLKNKGVIFQDILDVKEEYRVIMFNTPVTDNGKFNCVVEKRIGYGITDPRRREHWEIPFDDMCDWPHILPKLHAMTSNSRSPYIAFDVYITTDDEWGCFETSRHPGLVYNPETIKLMIDYTTQALFKLLGISKE